MCQRLNMTGVMGGPRWLVPEEGLTLWTCRVLWQPPRPVQSSKRWSCLDLEGRPHSPVVTTLRSASATGSRRSFCRCYLEVVCCVAVSVLGYMQKDEEVLPEVVGHSRKPAEAEEGEAEGHHLRGWRPRRLDELKTQQEDNVSEDPVSVREGG